MYILHQSLIAWKLAITALHLIAISLTTFRLWFRHKRRRLWMDDYTVIPPLVFNIINAIVIWMMYVEKGNDSKLKSKVALYWLMSIPWYTITWFTRMSLTLSITRVFPAWGTLRRCARGVAISLAAIYVGFMCWLFTATCHASDNNTPSSAVDFLDCSSERSTLTLTGLVADIGTCVFLFVAPLVMLAALPLSRGQRIQVFTLLGSGTLVLVSAVTFCAFQYSHTISGPGREVVIGMVSQIEAGVSIISCNLLVVIKYFYRHDGSPDDIDDSIEWTKKHPTAEEIESTRTIRSLAPVPPINKRNSSHWSARQTFFKGVSFSEDPTRI